MARRIRVIQDARPASFSEQLEGRAREIVASSDEGGSEDSAITGGMRSEIALTLDHIERTRALHQELRSNLLRHECYLSTEILQREPRGHQVYNDYPLPERDRLRDRLRELEKERRHLAMVENDQLRGLINRLSTLVSQHVSIS